MAALPSYLQSLEAVLGKNTPSTATPSPSSQPSASVAAPSSVPKLPTFLTSPQLTAGLTTSNNGTTSDKLKFLLVGTHCHQVTGYSKVTYGLVRILSKMPNISLTHFGFQKNPGMTNGYRPYPPNVRVLDAAEMEKRSMPPGAPPQQGFGFSVLPDTIRHEKPDVVFLYNDMSVIARFLEEIRKSGVPMNFKIWLYVDQVYNSQLQGFIDVIKRDADRVFVFTKYWKKCLKDQGVNRPIDVLGHGFEHDVFTVQPRMEIRKKLGLPTDAFIITSLNRNQPRKRYDLLIMAFTELIVKHPTKPIVLLCICDKGEKGGWWLFEIFHRELKLRGVSIEQFQNRLMLSSQDMSFRDEEINLFYNLGDIGISTADGEGWGLCNFEQMGVGVPQVVPDVGGFKEFCNKDNSIIVKPKWRYYLPGAHSPVGGDGEVCDPHDFCVAMEEYIMDSEKRRKHGEEAKKTVQGFTLEKVTEDLVDRLNQEHKELMKERKA
jgi:glycosyltransferase involved in cell wall biosynthesis